MKTPKTILLFVFPILVLNSNASDGGYGWGSSLFASSNTEQYQRFTKQLDEWFLHNGFAPTKTKGTYIYEFDEHALTWIIVFNDKNKEVTANSFYKESFTSGGLARMQRINFELWKHLFVWTAAQKEVNDFISHDPDWCNNKVSSARRAYLEN